MHCLNLRHKGMFVTSGPDPDEFTFYDKYDGTAYWCVETQRGFGPDGKPGASRLLLRRARLLQALTPDVSWRRSDWAVHSPSIPDSEFSRPPSHFEQHRRNRGVVEIPSA